MSEILDIVDIETLLPHRFPMLLVDRVLALDPGKSIVGLKNVTVNEPFFTGHFPGRPVMPGVMILEAMAQVAGLMMLALPENRGKLAYIAKMESVRFRIPIVPGDSLVMGARMLRARGAMGTVELTATVDDKLAAECIMTFAIRDRIEPNDVDAKLAKAHLEAAGGKDDGCA